MLRRNIFGAAALLPLALIGCATTPGAAPVTLAQMQAYADDVIDALSAAAQAYVASPTAKNVALVNQLVADLQQTKTAIDAISGTSTDPRSIALQVVGFAQQLTPLVLAFLGPAGPFVPLGLAVLQAFIQSLPPPPAAPPTPPAALHRAALKYRHQQ